MEVVEKSKMEELPSKLPILRVLCRAFTIVFTNLIPCKQRLKGRTADFEVDDGS